MSSIPISLVRRATIRIIETTREALSRDMQGLTSSQFRIS